MIKIKPHTLAEIIPNYKVFMFDIWGVMHNGIQALPGATQAINNLQQQDKIVMAVSNSTRSATYISNHFKELGFDIAPDYIFTSGDTCRHYLATHQGKLYHVGAEFNLELLQGLEVEVVDSVSQADSVLLTPYIYDPAELGNYDEVLTQALERNLTVMCANPDIMAMHGENYHYCPGAIAQRYENMGGEVIYFGKPHKPIFQSALSFASQLIPDLDTREVVMFGDTLETDIKGALAMGFDSTLLLTGNVGNDLKVNGGGQISINSFPPTWILTSF